MTDELFDLTDGVAIVTGGGTGIGAPTARMLAEQGADVIVAARTLADLVMPASRGASSHRGCFVRQLVDGLARKRHELQAAPPNQLGSHGGAEALLLHTSAMSSPITRQADRRDFLMRRQRPDFASTLPALAAAANVA